MAGTSRDTAAFAVGAVRRRRLAEGSLRCPRATRLLVTCDAGGSDSQVSRLWKDQLAVFAAQSGPQVTVCRFPPGTGKRNKTGHRLFCHITRTWKARPLMTKEDAVAGIAAAVTVQGLKCTAVPDETHCPDGVKVSGARTSVSRSTAPHGSRRPDVTGYLLALRLRSHLNLPAKVAGALPGTDHPTVRHAAVLARELLSAARITLPDPLPPANLPRTPDELLAYAAAAGIPLADPENGYPMPEHSRTHRYPTTRNTPGTAK